MKYWMNEIYIVLGIIVRITTDHATCVGSGDSVDQSAPDVEVLTRTTVRICWLTVALLGTGSDIIFVQEDKTHILRVYAKLRYRKNNMKAHPWGAVGSISGTKDEFITSRNIGLGQGVRSVTTTVLNVS
jgi:hypothetical protein